MLYPVTRLGEDAQLTIVDSSAYAGLNENTNWWQLVARCQEVGDVLMGYYAIPDHMDEPLNTVVDPLGMEVSALLCVQCELGLCRSSEHFVGCAQVQAVTTAFKWVAERLKPGSHFSGYYQVLTLIVSVWWAGCAGALPAPCVEQWRWALQVHCVTRPPQQPTQQQQWQCR